MSSNNSSLALDEYNGEEATQAEPKLALLLSQAFEPNVDSFLQKLPAQDAVAQISGRITVSF